MTNKAQLDNYDEIIERLNDMFENNTDKVNYSIIVYAGFMSAFDRVIEEKSKYKRALEIIKKYLNIELVYVDDGCEPTWYLDSNGGREIEQEEYELLEELIKNETENRN